MEHFVVSARKYRPRLFDEVVGQKHISDTLKNSIKSNHLAHAFLFCGPRGVGKTTTARILAKTINCTNITPQHEACGQCESCTSFDANSSFNIHELDAASNNSVEDIRSLVDQVRYAPQNGKYKIYIIDEVHMLSTAAFNAFLKTLEEPPSYAIFILATTEKHKIIPTILSRCQIFDFRRISNEDIYQHLQGICTKEQIQGDELALQLIAQKADGGLRDALSMFDRMASLREGKIVYEDVIDNLNILDFDYFFNVTDAVFSENISYVLTTLDEVMGKGFEAESFLNGLAEHFRNLLVCKYPSTEKLMYYSGKVKERFFAQAQLVSTSYLVNALNLCAEADMQLKTAKNKRLLAEMCLIKMCYISRLTQASLTNIEDTKKKITTPHNVVSEVEKIATPPKETQAPPPAQPVIKKETPVSSTASSNTFLNLEALKQQVQKEQFKKETPVVTKNTTAETPILQTGKTAPDATAFYTAWNAIIPLLQDITGLYELIQEVKPQYENGVIRIPVATNIQKRLLDDDKSIILKQLRQTSGYETYSFEVYIVEKTEAAQTGMKKAYTKKEIYDEFIEKNPMIDELRKKLGLELDY